MGVMIGVCFFLAVMQDRPDSDLAAMARYAYAMLLRADSWLYFDEKREWLFSKPRVSFLSEVVQQRCSKI